MDRPELINALNRLLQILDGSLAVYLQHAQPWARPNNQKTHAALANLAADQQKYAERIAETIEHLGGRVQPGRFPLQFASMHDLALDYLARETLQRHGRDVEAIRCCLENLAEEPAARSLAEEVLHNQRRHLETLKALVNQE